MSNKKISVNVMDLTKDNIFTMCVINPIVKNKILFNAEPDRIDGMSVILECDRERALAIVEVARLKWNKNQMRFYEGKKKI